MKRIGIEPIYRKLSTSKPTPRHNGYPYLLRTDYAEGETA
jgi:hypothetical protein